MDIKAYGTWEVTTEGDVEGRSVRSLGVHEGYLDEIALNLAVQAYYGLRFIVVKDPKQNNRSITKNEVEVSLDISSGTWDLNKTNRVQYFKDLLRGRPIFVEEGTYYASVKLTTEKQTKQEEIINKLEDAGFSKEDMLSLSKIDFRGVLK